MVLRAPYDPDAPDHVRTCTLPPPQDGVIEMELAPKPVPYHIAYCFDSPFNDRQGHALALLSCRIACMSIDAVHGRRPLESLRSLLSEQCLRRLSYMAALLKDPLPASEEYRRAVHLLPSVPRTVNGVLVSPSRFESAIGLSVGTMHYWACVVLLRHGCRWLCTLADIG